MLWLFETKIEEVGLEFNDRFFSRRFRHEKPEEKEAKANGDCETDFTSGDETGGSILICAIIPVRLPNREHVTEVEDGGDERHENGSIKDYSKTNNWCMSRSTICATRETYTLTRFMTRKNVKTPKLNNPIPNIGTSARRSSI